MPELLPGVAQVAIQGGTYVAQVIHRQINGGRPMKPFWNWDKGNMAVVGRTFAVADLKHAKFSGLGAWLLWALVHIYFLIGFANRLLVIFQWAISLVTKRRGVRILPLAHRNDAFGSRASQEISFTPEGVRRSKAVDQAFGSEGNDSLGRGRVVKKPFTQEH
jgi:NADH dehydrogenase